MFKKIITTLSLCCVSTCFLQASLQIAIPFEDFQAGNSVVLIARDVNGQEQVAGCVSLQKGKTQFSCEDIACQDQILSSITDQKSTVISDVEQQIMHNNNDNVVYLYFEVDPAIHVVRVLIIKKTLLADNPFDIIEFSSTLCNTNDEDDDFFGSTQDDDLSELNLVDIHVDVQPPLSYFDKVKLAASAFLAIQSSHVKQLCKDFTQWITKNHEK